MMSVMHHWPQGHFTSSIRSLSLCASTALATKNMRTDPAQDQGRHTPHRARYRSATAELEAAEGTALANGLYVAASWPTWMTLRDDSGFGATIATHATEDHSSAPLPHWLPLSPSMSESSR